MNAGERAAVDALALKYVGALGHTFAVMVDDRVTGGRYCALESGDRARAVTEAQEAHEGRNAIAYRKGRGKWHQIAVSLR